MVVDLLFPGTTDDVANLSRLINQFIDAGLVGLVTFIVAVALGVSALRIIGRPL